MMLVKGGRFRVNDNNKKIVMKFNNLIDKSGLKAK